MSKSDLYVFGPSAISDSSENVVNLVRRLLEADFRKTPELYADRLNDVSVALWELDRNSTMNHHPRLTTHELAQRVIEQNAKRFLDEAAAVAFEGPASVVFLMGRTLYRRMGRPAAIYGYPVAESDEVTIHGFAVGLASPARPEINVLGTYELYSEDDAEEPPVIRDHGGYLVATYPDGRVVSGEQGNVPPPKPPKDRG